MTRSAILLSCLWMFGGSWASGSAETLKVLTLNVWHGLRSGESNWRFPGEDADRAAARFAWQIEEIKRLDPDVLLLQEVNPNQRQARRYAEALGYDEIHKVTSCGIHLGALFKIPTNVNEGLAILAKRELRLRRLGTKRLSGNAMCTASWGFQTRESRYALFGVITVSGHPVLVTTAHLAAPAFVPEDFDHKLEGLVETGQLTAAQKDEILAERDRKLQRNTVEAERWLAEVSRHRRRLVPASEPPAVLGGDFNAEPDKPSVARMRSAGFAEFGGGPDFHTWNPPINQENYSIGTKRHFALPTFDNPEVEAMLDERDDTPRQIDHLFGTSEVEEVTVEMVMAEPKDGIYPSDHFGILATVRLP